MLIVRRISSNDLFRQYMKFNDYYNTISEAKREKEPESDVQLPDGTWRRVTYVGDVYYSKTRLGSYHRLDGPAIEWLDGSKQWFVDGKLHRMDGPAIEYADGRNLWFVNGELHRTDGPAVEWSDGRKAWYVNGKLHRSDGPAVEYADGSKQWWVNSHLHRLDGPAIEWLGGGKQWYVNGKEYSEEEFNTIFGGSKDLAVLKQRAASNDLFR